MPTVRLAPWKRVALYSAFTLVALLFSFVVTFNYEVLGTRVKQAAEAKGWNVTFDSLGPGFFSAKAKGVKVSKHVEPGQDAPEPLRIDSISVRPTLLPPGIKVSGDAFNGSFGFTVSGFGLARMAMAGGAPRKDSYGGANVRVVLDDIDLASPSIKGYTGLDLVGEVSGNVALEMPVAGDGTGADLSQATGSVTLDTKGVTMNGGTLTLSLPMYGPEPTPLPMPKVILGELTGRVKFDKGVGTVEELKSKSSDLELNVSGTVKLNKRIDLSEPNLEIRLKPDPEFQKRLGPLGAGFAMVPADPKDPNWRMGKLTGYLNRPRFP